MFQQQTSDISQLSSGSIYFPLVDGCNFWLRGRNPTVSPFELLSSTFLWYCLWYDHSDESYWAVLSTGTVYYAVKGGSNFWVYGWNPVVWPLTGVTIHMKAATSLLLNKYPPSVPPIQCSNDGK